VSSGAGGLVQGLLVKQRLLVEDLLVKARLLVKRLLVD